MKLAEKVPLSRHTTMGVGGPASYFCEAETVEEVLSLLSFARERRIPIFVLGGGSNVVFSDRGFSGLVIRQSIRGIRIESGTDGATVTAGAGEEWDRVVAEAVAHGLAGIECLSGIPGSVGATPIQNVGAYGQEVSQTIVSVEVIDRSTGQVCVLPAAECGFGYRTSRFKISDRRRFVVLTVAFRLCRESNPELRYGDLCRYFAERGVTRPTPVQVREAVLAIRAAKGMVVDPTDPNSRSCGSFFLNPVVPKSCIGEMEALARVANALGPEEPIPFHDAGDSRAKLSAAWLIEHAGFRRGMRVGNVGLSEKHVLALVNLGGASAAETIHFMADIMGRVRASFGVTLEPEPVLAMF